MFLLVNNSNEVAKMNRFQVIGEIMWSKIANGKCLVLTYGPISQHRKGLETCNKDDFEAQVIFFYLDKLITVYISNIRRKSYFCGTKTKKSVKNY